MPDLIVGSVPRGEDYFGREILIESLWEKLEKHNIILAAPRRFGKTGAMFKLLDSPREPFRPIYINVEHIMTAADFMVELIAVIMRDRHFSKAITKTVEFGRVLRDLPASIDLGGVKVELRERTDVSENWLSYGEKVLSHLNKDKPRLLLLIDEFAIMIENIDAHDPLEARKLLRWLRAVRTAPDTKSRLVIGSSINLISTLDKMGLVDVVNDFYIEKLDPFDEATARNFIQTIFSERSKPLSRETLDEILRLVGAPIPYLLAVLLTAIFDRQRAMQGDVSTEMVRAAFEDDLLGGATSAVFQHYRSRIDQYYHGHENRAAKAVLGLLSRADNPVQRSTLYQIFLKMSTLQASPDAKEDFVRLMYKLENDFYIVAHDGAFEFFSRVLKLWWKTHYGFQGE